MTARKTFLAALADTGVPLDTAFVELLTATAETSAEAVLDGYGADLVELRDGGEARAATRSLRTLVSVYVHEGSAYHHSAALLGPAAELADALAEEQYDNGLWEHGADGNPADTAFSIVDLSLIHHLLEEDAHEPTTGLRATIERILRLAGPSSPPVASTPPTTAGWSARPSPASTPAGPTPPTPSASRPGSPRASTSCPAASTANAAPSTRPR